MSPDIDELVRSTMRRHADDAPTRVDLDAVRTRSAAITRRRRFEAVTAVLTTLVLLLGAGYAASHIRTEAVAPVNPSPTAAAPDGLPWIAFPRFDPQAPPTGVTSIILRVDGVERAVATTGRGSAVLGWYGADGRTLVYTQGGDTTRESPLMTVTVSDDGRTATPPAPLAVPEWGPLNGLAFTVPGAGPVVWRPTDATLRHGEVFRVSTDLASATRVLVPPGRPLFATAALMGIGDGETGLVQLASMTRVGEIVGTFTMCLPFQKVATSLDGSHVAIACEGGTVQNVALGQPANPRLPAIPDGGGRGGVLGLWFDPGGGLHASTTPSLQSGYSEVNDYDFDGVGWNAAGHDVLERMFPETDMPVDLGYRAVEWAYTPHWVVTRPHEIDLGETTGGGLAVRTR